MSRILRFAGSNPAPVPLWTGIPRGGGSPWHPRRIPATIPNSGIFDSRHPPGLVGIVSRVRMFTVTSLTRNAGSNPVTTSPGGDALLAKGYPVAILNSEKPQLNIFSLVRQVTVTSFRIRIEWSRFESWRPDSSGCSLIGRALKAIFRNRLELKEIQNSPRSPRGAGSQSSCRGVWGTRQVRMPRILRVPSLSG